MFDANRNPKMNLRRLAWPIAAGVGAVALLAVAAVVIIAWPASEGECVRRALDLARLGELPPGASDVRAAGTSNLFSMSYVLRFRAPAGEIEDFIGRSVSLRGVAAEEFTPAHMCLPFAADAPPDAGHHRFHRDPRYPWFDPTIRRSGRRFVIPQDAQARWGEVLVDDATGTVLVRAGRS